MQPADKPPKQIVEARLGIQDWRSTGITAPGFGGMHAHLILAVAVSSATALNPVVQVRRHPKQRSAGITVSCFGGMHAHLILAVEPHHAGEKASQTAANIVCFTVIGDTPY